MFTKESMGRVLAEWGARPITYLEIGVWRGESMLWMAEHVLTHKRSRAIGIDPWTKYEIYNDNKMELIGDEAHHVLNAYLGKIKLVQSTSLEAMGGDFGLMDFHGIKKENVDVCFLDGDPGNTLVDLLLIWPTLKVGGWLILGDIRHVQFAKFRKLHDDMKRLWKCGWRKKARETNQI